MHSPTKPLVAEAAGGPERRPPLPGAMLVIRGVSLGAVQGLQLLRYGGGVFREQKVAQWPAGRLGASQLAELEEVFIEQLHRALAEHIGVQGELWEALGS